MDLQLGLGISSGPALSLADEEFQSYGYGGQMSGGFSYNSGGGNSNYTDNHFLDQTFDEINADRQIPQTLPLLVWNEENENLHNNGFDLDHQGFDEHLHTQTNSLEINSDAGGDVGWPPISYRRRRMSNQNHGGGSGGGGGGGGGERMTDWVAMDNGDGGEENESRGLRNSVLVKVNMVGEGIGRKVDLSLHHCLQSLIQTLLAMFGEESLYSYKLVYQDKQGFWQLAEEDSWGTLIGHACRLRLLKNNYYPPTTTLLS